MNHPAQFTNRLAALALGLADADSDGSLASHLATGCETCATELRRYRETAALLALGIEPLHPPEALRQRILDRLGGNSFAFVLNGTGEWRKEDGLEVKVLFDTQESPLTLLLSLSTGSWLADAYRPGHLGYVIMRGELDGEGMRLGVGDFLPAAGNKCRCGGEEYDPFQKGRTPPGGVLPSPRSHFFQRVAAMDCGYAA